MYLERSHGTKIKIKARGCHNIESLWELQFFKYRLPSISVILISVNVSIIIDFFYLVIEMLNSKDQPTRFGGLIRGHPYVNIL